LGNYSKLFISLGGTAGLVSLFLQDGSMSNAEIGIVSMALFQNFLTWLVPNYSPPKDQSDPPAPRS
jgi:hypothetical protein